MANELDEKQREILKLKKLYLIQYEKFETKFYFSFLSLIIMGFVTYTKLFGLKDWKSFLYFSIFLLGLLLIGEVLHYWRFRRFSELIKEIALGKVSPNLKWPK